MKKTCCFFGHRTYVLSDSRLRDTIESLITERNVKNFLVGNHGNFDYAVLSILKQMQLTYPDIKYQVVLAYMPGKSYGLNLSFYNDTIYPDELADVPQRFAITHRNRWIVEHSHIAVVYVFYKSGASQAMDYAKRKGLDVINIADYDT